MALLSCGTQLSPRLFYLILHPLCRNQQQISAELHRMFKWEKYHMYLWYVTRYYKFTTIMAQILYYYKTERLVGWEGDNANILEFSGINILQILINKINSLQLHALLKLIRYTYWTMQPIYLQIYTQLRTGIRISFWYLGEQKGNSLKCRHWWPLVHSIAEL
jgi:hypothetical protein